PPLRRRRRRAGGGGQLRPDQPAGPRHRSDGVDGRPLLVSADVLVIANAGGGVTAYDRTTGRPRWRTDGPARGDVLDSGLAARVLDGWLVVYDREASTYCSPACSTVSVLEPSTGSLFRAPPGRLITTANGTVVTQTEGLR